MDRKITGKAGGFLLCLLLGTAVLAGCGTVSTEKGIKEWADSCYDIKTEVTGSEKTENGMKYTLRSEEGVTFEATSEMDPFYDLDGGDSVLFEYVNNRSDYYYRLIEFHEKEIHEIEDQYGVKFIMTGNKKIEAVCKEGFQEEDPEEDLKLMSDAVKELAEVIHPQPSYGESLSLLNSYDPWEQNLNWYFQFTEEEPGRIMHFERPEHADGTGQN